MMHASVTINTEQCKKIAERILPLKFRDTHFQRPFLTFKSDNETKLRTFLYSSAICHQTHTLINKVKNLKGWSCLEDVFTKLGEENSPLLQPEYLSQINSSELSEALKPLFADDGNPENCTLDRLEQRSGFLIQIAKVLINKYQGRVQNLLEKSQGNILKQGIGLYDLLTEFEAFVDPLKKKSTVFLQLVDSANLFEFNDLDNIEPVMDYHMQRLLLRTGCIEIVDEKLKQALIKRTLLPTDEPIRLAAVEAIRLIGKLAQKNFFEMDEILWSLARSCCKEKTLCADKTCNKNPCTFFTFINLTEHTHCIFENICPGRTNETYRSYWQPNVDTHYY